MPTKEEIEARRTLWAEALESGRFVQGRRALRVGDRYCCLGVLCDISGVGHWDRSSKSEYLSEKSKYLPEDGSEGNADILPTAVMEWIGVDQPWMPIQMQELPRDWASNVVVGSLCEFNDKGATFAEIAQLIRNGEIIDHALTGHMDEINKKQDQLDEEYRNAHE